jgi:hypothetical protein
MKRLWGLASKRILVYSRVLAYYPKAVGDVSLNWSEGHREAVTEKRAGGPAFEPRRGRPTPDKKHRFQIPEIYFCFLGEPTSCCHSGPNDVVTHAGPLSGRDETKHGGSVRHDTGRATVRSRGTKDRPGCRLYREHADRWLHASPCSAGRSVAIRPP